MTDIYLQSPYEEAEVVSDILYIYIFSAIALLILLIACINYINLATAKAADRAREVGIRKVVGALRKQLFAQFIGESVLLTFFAFLCAFFIAQLLLPLFNELTGKSLPSQLLYQPGFLTTCFGVLIAIALLAGAYPALAITAFKPVHVLKGNFKTSGKGIWLRKSLVVFQFGISAILIMGTLIILQQLDFLQKKNLGYEKENVIVIPLDRHTRPVFESLKSELLRQGLASQIARGSESPVQIKGGYSINVSGNDSPGIITTGLLADEGYISTLGMGVTGWQGFYKSGFRTTR